MAILDRDRIPEKIRIEQHSASGLAWFGAWLFTMAFLRLTLWKCVLALFLWPYFLGSYFAAPMR